MRKVTSPWWLALALAALLAAGCSGLLSGNLMEKQYQDGRIERLKVDGGERWSSYDKNSTKPDETCIILKSEKTF
jgi:hypothetical protein